MIISSVIVGALISGLIGALSGLVLALASAYFHDRSARILAHHLKHKENFAVLMDAIKQDAEYVLTCLRKNGRDSFPKNEYYDEDKENLKNFNFFDRHGIYSPFYYDIEKHWPDFFEKVEKWIEEIIPMANKASNISKNVFEKIQNAKGIDELIKKYELFREGNKDLKYVYLGAESDCKLAVYNLVFEVSLNLWNFPPSDFEKAGVLGGLKDIADGIKQELKECLNEVKEVEAFYLTSEELIDDLKRLILEEKMKRKKCEYL